MVLSHTVLKAQEMTEGAGARVKRLFPQETGDHHDPFVLLDEFFVSPPTGFPQHPHRGFEAITYMKEGAFRHRDNLGNDRELGAGGIQRFTAGRGIVHAEMPGKEAVNHGFQLWINLPRRLKGIEPSYQAVDAVEIPESRKNGVKKRTLIGPDSPVVVHTDILCQDIISGTGAEQTISVEYGFTALVYVYAGRVDFLEMNLGKGEAMELHSGERIQFFTRIPSGILFIAGRPHEEPVYLNGSFVD